MGSGSWGTSGSHSNMADINMLILAQWDERDKSFFHTALVYSTQNLSPRDGYLEPRPRHYRTELSGSP
jgi:hypothetical protein